MTRSGHNFAHATAAQLSCHVHNYVQIGSLEWKLELNIFSQDFSYELIDGVWNGTKASKIDGRF